MFRFFAQPFRDSPPIAWGLLGLLTAVAAGSGAFLYSTATTVRFQRDIDRIVFNRNWVLLDQLSHQAGLETDSLRGVLAASAQPPDSTPYIVVSLEDRRLWLKQRDRTLFTTRVAVGSGKTLVKNSGRKEWKFDTPRGRLVVQSKEPAPVWVPPDWHYVELAKQKGLGIVRLQRGQQIPAGGGAVVMVHGNDVVERFPNGRETAFAPGEGQEIIAAGNVVIPPFGTNQRKFFGVLGTHRLDLGDGYGLHGTDDPSAIGHAVSHGCIRLRNEDIAFLYSLVPIGTPVFIY